MLTHGAVPNTWYFSYHFFLKETLKEVADCVWHSYMSRDPGAEYQGSPQSHHSLTNMHVSFRLFITLSRTFRAYTFTL
jgi:hypothetical protein